MHYDIHEHYFRNRVTSVWNSTLEEFIVVRSVDSFKNVLDKFWSNQKVVYDWLEGLFNWNGKS